MELSGVSAGQWLAFSAVWFGTWMLVTIITRIEVQLGVLGEPESDGGRMLYHVAAFVLLPLAVSVVVGVALACAIGRFGGMLEREVDAALALARRPHRRVPDEEESGGCVR